MTRAGPILAMMAISFIAAHFSRVREQKLCRFPP